MAKKSRIEGIDGIFRNTETEQRPEDIKTVAEETSRVIFECPVSLKQRLQIYCVQNKITLKEFITGAILEKLND